MEEDAFDDNGWSRFFAPNAQSRVDPLKAESDLELQQLPSVTDDGGSAVEAGGGAECKLGTEHGDNRIDSKMIKIDEQMNRDLKKWIASTDAWRWKKNEDTLQDQIRFHTARVTASVNHCCTEAKLTDSATELRFFDPLSWKDKDFDKDSTNDEEQAGDGVAKTVTELPLFESLPMEEDKENNNTKEAGKTAVDQAKTPLEGPPFPSLSLKKTNKDKLSINEGKAVGNQKKAVTGSSNFQSLYFKQMDKNEINSKNAGKADYSQMKEANYSSYVDFNIFNKTSLFIFRTAFQSCLRWILSTWLEKATVKKKMRTCYMSLLSNWMETENDDKNNTREAVNVMGKRTKAATELCHVRTGSTPSKSHKSKSSMKTQTAEFIATKPEFLRNPVKLLHSRFPLFLSVLISVVFQASGGTLVVAPRDVIGLKGQEVRLRCSTQYPDTVYWERILVGSNEQQTIYFGLNGMVNIEGANGRFKIDSDPATGRYDIVIKDLQPKDAATYICIGDNGIGEEKRAQLIVLDYFSCDMPMPGNGFMGENTLNLPVDDIQAECSFQYRGHMTPRIQWRLNNIPLNASFVNNGSTVRSAITLRGTKQLNGAKLSSLPTVSSAQDSESNADPWWTSPQLKVNYIHLELGEVAECRGDSAMVPVCVPSCEYQQVEMPNDSLCYCVAVYILDNVKYDITFNKYPCHGSDSVSNESSIIIIVVITTVLVLLIVVNVVLICVIKQIKRSRGHTCTESNPSAGSDTGLLTDHQTSDSIDTAEVKLGENPTEKNQTTKTQNVV